MSKPQIALIGPFDRNAPRPGQYVAPPLGVHRMAAYVRAAGGADVTVIDPALVGVRGLIRALRSTSPSLVGFSTLAPTLEWDLRLLAIARRILPRSLFVVGGQGVAGLESMLVEQGGSDVVVRGFGEQALLSICRLLSTGVHGREVLMNSRLADIPNLTLRNANGLSFGTAAAPATAELFRVTNDTLDFSRIPYPLYWELNQHRYPPEHVRVMRNEGLLRTIRLITYSHCPLGCNYCSSTRFLDVVEGRRQTVLMQTPAEIIATMEKALEAHPDTTAFYINDDDFVLQRHRALEFARLVIQRFEHRLSFIAMTRVDHVDTEMACSLSKAGFRLIFLGVETFAEHTLVAMEKRLRYRGDYTSMARRAVITLLDAGIVPQIGLIPFYPSVRECDLVLTIENAVELVGRGARLSIFPLTDAYPGASLFNGPYEISTKDVRIRGRLLKLPVHFLPASPSMRELAAKALNEHQRLRDRKRFENMPQPVDGLHFLRIVLREIGRNTAAIDRVLAGLEFAKCVGPMLPLQYMNA